jgi:hypothetical protein
VTASATAVVGWLILLIGQLTKRLESGGGHVFEEDQLGRMTKEHGMNQSIAISRIEHFMSY